MINTRNINSEITEKEIEEIINIDKENDNEEHKIDIDEDNKENIINNKEKNQNGVSKLDILEMKMEHIYIDVYNQIIPKFKDMIKNINEMKDIHKEHWKNNLIKPLIKEVLIENIKEFAELISENTGKDTNPNIENTNDDTMDLDASKVRRFNFLYHSKNNVEMDQVFKLFKKRKNLLEMKYAKTEETEVNYYILGKFKSSMTLDYKLYETVTLLEDGRYYKRSYEKYIKPNNLIAQYPEEADK